jgi:hypothetical protein
MYCTLPSSQSGTVVSTWLTGHYCFLLLQHRLGKVRPRLGALTLASLSTCIIRDRGRVCTRVYDSATVQGQSQVQKCHS